MINPPVDEHAARGRVLLVAHRIDLNTAVEVELLISIDVTGRTEPKLVEGTVAEATGAVLVLENARGRLARIPWAAIAVIRDQPNTAPHPAL